MQTEKDKKNPRKRVKKKFNEDAKTDDYLEYDGPYKDDPFKEKEIIIS